MGKNVGVGDGMGYLKNKNLRVGVAVFNPGEGDGLISNCEKNWGGGGGGRVIYKPPEHPKY